MSGTKMFCSAASMGVLTKSWSWLDQCLFHSKSGLSLVSPSSDRLQQFVLFHHALPGLHSYSGRKHMSLLSDVRLSLPSFSIATRRVCHLFSQDLVQCSCNSFGSYSKRWLQITNPSSLYCSSEIIHSFVVLCLSRSFRIGTNNRY